MYNEENKSISTRTMKKSKMEEIQENQFWVEGNDIFNIDLSSQLVVKTKKS